MSRPPERRSVELDGVEVSYLEAGEGEPVLLLHGTFWSRVWQPVMAALGEHVRAIAPDFPGFGRSGGRLDTATASVPALSRLAGRFAEAVGIEGSFGVAGHDIGGGVAQQLAIDAAPRVRALALVNGVLLGSWPVPAVERFGDPAVAEAITPEEMIEARAKSLDGATARRLEPDERDDYLSPWRGSEDRTRSWAAMAAAADARYTLAAVPELARLAPPILLVWGEDDEFQKLEYAERFVRELPTARLVRIPGARHIPTEDDPAAVADALIGHFASS